MTEAWEWWASRDEENYTVGPETSREAVIEAARVDFDGEPFHIVEAVKRSAASLIPSAGDFIERALEDAADNGEFGEDGDFGLCGKPETQSEAIAELDAAISAWAAKWSHILPTPWAFRKTRNAEWIERRP